MLVKFDCALGLSMRVHTLYCIQSPNLRGLSESHENIRNLEYLFPGKVMSVLQPVLTLVVSKVAIATEMLLEPLLGQIDYL